MLDTLNIFNWSLCVKKKFVNLVAVAELPTFCVVGERVPDHVLEQARRRHFMQSKGRFSVERSVGYIYRSGSSSVTFFLIVRFHLLLGYLKVCANILWVTPSEIILNQLCASTNKLFQEQNFSHFYKFVHVRWATSSRIILKQLCLL